MADLDIAINNCIRKYYDFNEGFYAPFGSIASVGINSLIKNKVDMGNTRNLVIASLILTLGIGGAEMTFSGITIGGIGLAALVGVLLNLILPKREGWVRQEMVLLFFVESIKINIWNIYNLLVNSEKNVVSIEISVLYIFLCNNKAVTLHYNKGNLFIH